MRIDSLMTFPTGIVLYRPMWNPLSMVPNNNQLKDMSSSTHHTKVNIYPTIVTPSFLNITHNIDRAPYTTSPKFASTTSDHKEIIFLRQRVILLTFFTSSL